MWISWFELDLQAKAIHDGLKTNPISTRGLKKETALPYQKLYFPKPANQFQQHFCNRFYGYQQPSQEYSTIPQ